MDGPRKTHSDSEGRKENRRIPLAVSKALHQRSHVIRCEDWNDDGRADITFTPKSRTGATGSCVLELKVLRARYPSTSAEDSELVPTLTTTVRSARASNGQLRIALSSDATGRICAATICGTMTRMPYSTLCEPRPVTATSSCEGFTSIRAAMRVARLTQYRANTSPYRHRRRKVSMCSRSA